MRHAAVFRRQKQLIFHAWSLTTEGLWIADEPFLVLPESCDNIELARAVRSTLDGTRHNLPHPTDWKGLAAQLLVVARVKTWSALARGASCVHVEEEGGRIVIVPQTNLGPRKGFCEDRNRLIAIENTSADLAPSIRRLLS